MGLLELLKDKIVSAKASMVTWPEGTEYLSNGPFFEDEEEEVEEG